MHQPAVLQAAHVRAAKAANVRPTLRLTPAALRVQALNMFARKAPTRNVLLQMAITTVAAITEDHQAEATTEATLRATEVRRAAATTEALLRAQAAAQEAASAVAAVAQVRAVRAEVAVQAVVAATAQAEAAAQEAVEEDKFNTPYRN